MTVPYPIRSVGDDIYNDIVCFAQDGQPDHAVYKTLARRFGSANDNGVALDNLIAILASFQQYTAGNGDARLAMPVIEWPGYDATPLICPPPPSHGGPIPRHLLSKDI